MRIRKNFIVIASFVVVIAFSRTSLAEINRPTIEKKPKNLQKASAPPMSDKESETVSDRTEAERPAKFYSVLDAVLSKRRLKRENLCDERDEVQKRILNEYGAVFLATDKVQIPPVCMFGSEAEVEQFQSSTTIGIEEIDGVEIQLQAAAMTAYLDARREALEKGLTLTPRDGAEAGRRSFSDTLRLWNTRFLPAGDHWVRKGKLSAAEFERLKSLPVKEQVSEVLRLEKRGIFFNTFFNNSILYSVAAPGTSQHLSLLALDINEFENKRVQEIMARHGWFRTVRNDAPHFTFLGYKKDELKKLGLKKIETGRGEYWIPNV